MIGEKYYQKLMIQRRKLAKLFFQDDILESQKDEYWSAMREVDKLIDAEKDRQEKAMDAFIHCIDGDNFDMETFKKLTKGEQHD